MKNEIILYQSDELQEHIEVKLEDETVWLTQIQMASLFNQTKQNISLHINNCFKEGEVEKAATVKEFLTVQKEGKRKVKRKIEYYNLDVIISVGYRVKSKQGTQFRIWANKVLKDYLMKGYAVNNRINRLEDKIEKIEGNYYEIALQLKTRNIPTQGIFFEGQVFDAYVFVSDIIKKAETEIILIDNYIDESTLIHLSKKKEKVKLRLYTNIISRQLVLDVQKANEQYGNVEIRKLTLSHDRFLIIDRKELYHLGASLKDLGRKWFAFSRMDSLVKEVLNKIE